MSKAYLSLNLSENPCSERNKAEVGCRSSETVEVDDPKFIGVVAELTSEGALDRLSELGCVVMRQRGNFVIVCVPVGAIGSLSRSDFVLAASCGRAQALMDKSRQSMRVDMVHACMPGATVSGGYSGKGVVTGMCDIGFDPNHEAFAGRLGAVAFTNTFQAEHTVYTEASEIKSLSTDCADMTHGTHVANIMSGALTDTPYFGVACGSTLVATMSNLDDAALLLGIEEIIDYAKAHDMPAVVNLSVGSFLGPHDGTDVVCRYLALMAQEATICFSAGNFGSSRVHFAHSFSGSESAHFGFFIDNADTWNGQEVSGCTDAWSADGRSFEVSYAVYDYIDGVFVYESPWMGCDGGDFEICLGGGDSSPLSQFYSRESFIKVYGGVNPINGRYNISTAYNLSSSILRPGTNWARYYTCMRIRAAGGVSVDAYADGENVFFHPSGVKGCLYHEVDGALSDFCTADGVVAVGAYTTRNEVSLVSGDVVRYDYTLDAPTAWSSFGTMIDGRRFPHFCAPGCYIVSALSEPYHIEHPDFGWVADFPSASRHNRYYAECGTSMASPAAAGVFALWLEADRTLSPAQLLDIACLTARTDVTDPDNPRWGAGAIDAKAGLDYVVRNASVCAMPDRQGVEIAVTDGVVSVWLPGVDTVEFEVFDMQGRRISSPRLSPGVYLLCIDGRFFNDHVPMQVKVAVR